MKIKKTVTDAVVAANRDNSGKSTGAATEQGKRVVSQNAIRHSLLSNKVVLETPEERKEYRHILELWMNEFHQRGVLQTYLVERVVTIIWKLGIIETLESQALSQRKDAVDDIKSVFTNEMELPIDSGDLPNCSWDVERLVIRAVSGNEHANSDGSRHPMVVNHQVLAGTQSNGLHQNSKRGLLEVEAVLGNSLDTLTRYRTRLDKEFYRCLDTLILRQSEDKDKEDP